MVKRTITQKRVGLKKPVGTSQFLVTQRYALWSGKVARVLSFGVYDTHERAMKRAKDLYDKLENRVVKTFASEYGVNSDEIVFENASRPCHGRCGDITSDDDNGCEESFQIVITQIKTTDKNRKIGINVRLE